MIRRLILPAAFAALGAAAALAQPPPMAAAPPVVGAVKAVAPDHITVTTASGDVEVAVDAKTRVLLRQPSKAEEIKPGVYLGTTNMTAADGVSNKATEVHVMSDGPNVHYPMDPKNDPAKMMTNGHVKSVTTTARGEEMEVDYGQGATRHVVVTRDTAVTHMVDIGVAGLKPGMHVSARGGAAGKAASFISVDAPK